MHVSEHIQAGTCFVNCYNKTDAAAPFGGFKQSGFGKDLGMMLNSLLFLVVKRMLFKLNTGEEALHEYLRIKVITIEY